MIDSDGYRANVGIILSNSEGNLLWAKRAGENAWQFPQGGIREHETVEKAMYRELHEEIGLDAVDVEIAGRTQGWLRYKLPERLIRYHHKPVCIGQKQIWYLLNLISDENKVCLDYSDQPEFDSWRWVTYWLPIEEVVSFKKSVYECALKEFAPLIFPDKYPSPLPG